MGEVRRTLIPQFSLRLILGIISATAVAAFVVSTAGRGWAWAAGVSVGLLALVVSFLIYAILFFVAWLMAVVLGAGKRRSPDKTSAGKTLLGLLVVSQLAIAPRAALAVSGGSITLPHLGPNEVNNTGLELTLDTVWIDSSGYRPVRLQVKSITGPVKADRALTVRFRPHLGYVNQNSMIVTQTVEIPAGSEKAEATLTVPQEGNWGSFELDVFEDGKYLDQLSIGPNGVGTSWSSSYQGDETRPVFLCISDAKPLPHANFFEGGEVLVVGNMRAAALDASTTTPSSSNHGNLTIDELPSHWIDYSGVDAVTMARDEMTSLESQHAAQWRAIRDWLQGGGTLIVYDVGKNWNKIAEVERLIGIDNAGDETDLVKRGWRLPDRRERYPKPIQSGAGPGDAAEQRGPPEAVAADRAPFVTRACGLGMVAAIRTDDVGEARWNGTWLKNTLGAERLQWSQRYGLSLSKTNDDVWNFLIPGVGLAPVGKFQIFITLFVLAVGPVNYFLLRRWGKLNLMVLTVPAAALVVIVGLVATAVLADGLGVRLRARSITHIEQKNGEAICWARLSYYAGLAPSGGLQFSGNTVVLPLENQPDAIREERGPARVVDWWRRDVSDAASPLAQRLTEGWLAARTPTQFVTQRVGATQARLEIKPGGADQPPTVTNRLGTRIQQLVLVDENGRCFGGENVQQEATSILTPAASQSELFLARINPLVLANQPQLPPSMIQNFGNRSLFGFGNQAQSAKVPWPGQVRTLESRSPSLLERSIREVMDQLNNDQLPLRTYVAIVEESPEMELGTPSAREEASFHVVVGQY